MLTDEGIGGPTVRIQRMVPIQHIFEVPVQLHSLQPVVLPESVQRGGIHVKGKPSPKSEAPLIPDHGNDVVVGVDTAGG